MKDGEVAGKQEKRGHWRVKINGKLFLVHRVVYCMHHENVSPELVIDHINGDNSDNKVCNLRQVERLFNNRNSKLSKNNNTGFTGVSYQEQVMKNGNVLGYYIAYVNTDSYVSEHKSFSCLRYGKSKALELAVAWRNDKMKTLEEKSFGYTPRHGK